MDDDLLKTIAGLAKESSQLYVLKDRVPVLETDASKWFEFFTCLPARVVGFQSFTLKGNMPGTVSTVFIGVPVGTLGDKPLLFETLVTVGYRELARLRYATWADAEMGHTGIVDLLRDLSCK